MPDRAVPATLVVLTGVTGVIDAASFLGMGHIFTANMTGNVVFLGFAFAGAPGLSVARSGMALAAFLAGAALGGRLLIGMFGASRTTPIVRSCAAEAALLAGAALVTLAAPVGGSDDAVITAMVIILTAFAMGLRNATVRALGVPDLTTTVLTLTLTGLAAESRLAGGGNPRWVRRTASVLAMAAGATLGVVLLRRGLACPLLFSAIVVGGCAAVLRLQERGPTPEPGVT